MINGKFSSLDELMEKNSILSYKLPVEILERVRKQNLWTMEYTERVAEEYLRFMFLATKNYVVPSLEVDEIWHAHLLFSRDYSTFCKEFLQRTIHHGPSTTLASISDDKEMYATTKRLYFMYFSETPPEDIWPSSNVRFRNVHFANIDLLTHWVFPAGDWKACAKVLLKHLFLKLKLW